MRDETGTTRSTRRLPPVAVAVASALCVFAAQASAVIVHVQGRALSYQPAPHATSSPLAGTRSAGAPAVKGGSPSSASSPLVYHSGPVMASNTDYTLYWDPTGGSAYPAGYESGLDRYFEDLAHDSGGLLNTDSVLTQYYGDGGEHANYDSRFGGALLDTDPYPANGCTASSRCLTDAQIRAEIVAYAEARGLPADLQHEYLVLTPPGVESCMEAASKSCSAGTTHRVYCAYHGFVQAGASVFVYADDPYVEGLECDVGGEHPNGNPSDATIAGGLAHEHSESVTDPELSTWYDSKGNEVADKCRTLKAKTEYGDPLGTAPDGASYNQVIDGDLYLYQQMWSNAAGGCEQRSAQLPSITKMKPKSGSPSGGTAVTITGSDFVNPASVNFGEVPASEVVVDSTSTIVAVAPPGAPRSIVDVTVTTASGTSAITKKDRFKYKAH